MPFKEDLEAAKKEIEDYASDMAKRGRIQDLSEDMYLILKDIAGGAYDIKPQSIIDDAKEIVRKVEGE